MSAFFNRGAGDQGAGDQGSGEPTGSEPRGDWRRKRGRNRQPDSRHVSPEPQESEGSAASSDEAGDGRRSPTVLSFLYPALHFISSYGTPIVIAGIIGLISGIVVVAFVGSMSTYGYVDITIGGVLILTVGLISLSSVMAAFLGRTGRYGMNSLIMILAFTGIVVVINFISFENHKRSDVTATNQFSLAQGTRQLLKELDEPVRATAFYVEDPNAGLNPDRSYQELLARRAQVEETLREFEAARSSKFSFRFVDPTLEPEIVRNYFGSLPTPLIQETIVVEGLDSALIHVVQPSDIDYSELEQDLYSSILVVSNQERKTIYFLSGHGERDLETADSGSIGDPSGYDNIRAALERDNYEVRTLRWSLLDEDVSVPGEPADGCVSKDPDCLPSAALLVIAGPKDNLPAAHASALSRYLLGKELDAAGNLVDRREAGRLMFLAEPEIPETFSAFMAFWGVFVGQGYIRDEDRSVQGLPHTLQLQMNNPLQLTAEATRSIDPQVLATLIGITAPKGQSLGNVRMPGAAPIKIYQDPNRDSAPLAFNSINSYLIPELDRVEPNKGTGAQSDPQGPFSPVFFVQAFGPLGAPAATSQPPDTEIARMVVFGDSDFVNNLNYNLGSGADLFLNSANYLLGDYSLVSIRPKAFTFREFNLNRNEYNFVRFSSWLFMPGLLGLMAAFVWWVRR